VLWPKPQRARARAKSTVPEKCKGKGTGRVRGPQDTLEDDLEDTLEEDLEALLSDEEARLERYRSLVAIIEWRLRCSGC